MDPRIRFARSKDGPAVAFWATGEGPTVVHMPWLPWSHVQLEWQNPEMNRWYSALAQHCRLVRYDVRGTGLSDRAQSDLDIEAQVSDLEAVVNELGLERFVLFGVFNSGPAALYYASQNPDRLSGLVLWCAYAMGEDYFNDPRVSAIRALIEDWELYTETGAHAFVGWSAGEAAHQLAALMRESVDADTARKFLAQMRHVDARDCLPRISTPTLVLHPRSLPLVDIDLARRIATGIKGARFLAVEGDSLAPTRVNMDMAIQGIREMLGEAPEAIALPVELPAPPGRLGALTGPREPLTSREVEVLRAVVQGKSTREIANDLFVSPRTVERHIANIYDKLDVNNRAQLTAFAIGNKLV